jgi:VIT1/CCC1 family predicted Fe2+/Mn2+ transporter
VRIAAAYALAGLIPLLPYFFPIALGRALLASVAVTGVALAVFGSVKATYTGASPLRSGLRTVGVGGAAAAVAFGIGRALALLGG